MTRRFRTSGDRRVFALAAVIVVTAVAVLAVEMTTLAAKLAAADNGTYRAPGPWVDWWTYANAFHRLVSGGAIYASEQLAGPYYLTHVVLIGYAYPPPAALLFAPFAAYPIGLVAWTVLNLGLLLTSLWAIISRAWPRYRGLIFGLVLLGLTRYPPFIDGLISANINLGLAGVIGWIAVGASSEAVGSFGALGALTKVFPAALAAATPTDKRRSVAIGVAITALVCLVSLPIVGLQSWLDFVRAISLNVTDCYASNWSIACTLAPYVGMPAGTAAGLAIGAAAALLLLLVRDRFWLALIASVAILAPVTNLHLHYWVVAPVLALAGAARLQKPGRMESKSHTGSS